LPFTTAVVGLTAVGNRGFVSFSNPHRLLDADGTPRDWLDDGWARLACVLTVRRWYTQSLDPELLDVDLLVAQMQVGIPPQPDRLEAAARKLAAVAADLRDDAPPRLATELSSAMEAVGRALPPGNPGRRALHREWAKLDGSSDRTLTAALNRWGEAHLVDAPEAALDVGTKLIDVRLLPRGAAGTWRSIHDATLTADWSNGVLVVTTRAHQDLPTGKVAGVEAVFTEARTGRQATAPVTNDGSALTASISASVARGTGSVELRAVGNPNPPHPARERGHRAEADLRSVWGYSLGRAAVTTELLLEGLPQTNPLLLNAMRQFERAAVLCEMNRRSDQADEIRYYVDGLALADPSEAAAPILSEAHAVDRFGKEGRDEP